MKKNSKEEFPLGLDFFSLFVHELKSPLMSLNFQLENLDSRLKEKESKAIIRKMNNDLIRLFQFVEDSLNMKELEQDFPLNLNWYTWSDFLKSIQEEMSEWISRKKIKVVNIESFPLKVHMDSKWMRIVLKNLLLNAIQHSPKNSTIQLQTKMKNNQDLFFSIKDEGAGIPENLKNKIFHRFQSTRSSGNSELKGTGLGLYLSKWIVEKHGGNIELLSSNHSGSVFGITLSKACKELLEKAS
ncbi:MAG: HAMP domain-containing sensor histidine kinase [Bdellovibrionales bacterium]|nr:HAMP domain-containing sensor histidine kinase [Bdellovibrionales bacterium]